TFMITASLFESITKPGYILLAVPFAIIGTLFLFFILDLTLDRGAYAGLLLLIGLSVNNSIMLVDHISKKGRRINAEGLINASYSRLRPIFTTTLTTAGALVPLLFVSEVTFWSSLSYSVLGGILFSSILTIVYVPLFYFIFSLKRMSVF
ncbi:RND efflux system, inner membrane transporter, partial [hydrothermal vent metagenome]